MHRIFFVLGVLVLMTASVVVFADRRAEQVLAVETEATRIDNPAIDYVGFLQLAQRISPLREARRLSLEAQLNVDVDFLAGHYLFPASLGIQYNCIPPKKQSTASINPRFVFEKLTIFGKTTPRSVSSRPNQRASVPAYCSTPVVGSQRPRGFDPPSISSGPPSCKVGKK